MTRYSVRPINARTTLVLADLTGKWVRYAEVEAACAAACKCPSSVNSPATPNPTQERPE